MYLSLTKNYKINDSTLEAMAPIVRGAETDTHHLATKHPVYGQ
ncbi:hypothetical protein AAKU52_002033 [Pedobacter sp. CG_S7]